MNLPKTPSGESLPAIKGLAEKMAANPRMRRAVKAALIAMRPLSEPQSPPVEDFLDALNDLDAVTRDYASVARLVPENYPGLRDALVRLFDAAIRLGYHDAKKAVTYVKEQLRADARFKTVWNKILPETYRKAAAKAAEQRNGGEADLFGQAQPNQEQRAATSVAESQVPAPEAGEGGVANTRESGAPDASTAEGDKQDVATIERLVDIAREPGRSGNVAYDIYRTVSDSEAEALQGETGIDVHGYQHVIDEAAIRHTLKEHGDPEVEERRGQVAVTAEDFARISPFFAIVWPPHSHYPIRFRRLRGAGQGPRMCRTRRKDTHHAHQYRD